MRCTKKGSDAWLVFPLIEMDLLPDCFVIQASGNAKDSMLSATLQRTSNFDSKAAAEEEEICAGALMTTYMGTSLLSSIYSGLCMNRSWRSGIGYCQSYAQ